MLHLVELPLLPLIFFVLTYLGLALGRIPPLKLDRTGFAILGAVAFLMLPFVGREPATGYALALASTFAGNAVLVGSIANLIVAEQAERLGVRLTFRDHLRLGLPVTLVSLALAVAAMALW